MLTQRSTRAMPRYITISGRRTATGGALEDVWGGPDVARTLPPSVGEDVKLKSSSVEDDISKPPAGTGIHIVELAYVDKDGVLKSAEVTLDGTSAVAGPVDLASIVDVRAKVVGTGGTAAGTIDVLSNDTLKVYERIAIGETQGRGCLFQVPAGDKLRVDKVSVKCDGKARVWLEATQDPLTGSSGSIWFVFHEVLSVGSPVDDTFERPYVFRPGVDIRMRMEAAAGIKVAANFSGELQRAAA